jgi:NAD(P)-dependent dehydrogenase (short-subunit alcohol dehydrogenase family)
MSSVPVAVITGATGPLGRVLAGDLAADGYHLALLGSDAGRLEALRDELGLQPDRTLTVGADLRDAAAAARAIDQVYQRFGQVDALAHLVGGWTGGTEVRDATDEPFTSMLDQHLWTTLNMTRELTPRLVAAGSGRIVAVSSPMADAPEPGMSAYAAGKAAEEALLMTLAREVAGTGVTVNVIRVRSIDPSADGSKASDQAQATTAAEICAAIRYLFKEEARAINGRRIPLHRG